MEEPEIVEDVHREYIDAGARVITLHPSVGGRDRDESYLEWLSGNVEALREALQ